jgi:hypothetical protein
LRIANCGLSIDDCRLAIGRLSIARLSIGRLPIGRLPIADCSIVRLSAIQQLDRAIAVESALELTTIMADRTCAAPPPRDCPPIVNLAHRPIRQSPIRQLAIRQSAIRQSAIRQLTIDKPQLAIRNRESAMEWTEFTWTLASCD